jgi:putative ABC transport system permease protein
MARLPLLRLFSLAMRQLLRDARAGELRVLFFALLVAVAASTAIGYFGARLNGAMMLRATEFLGADLVLEGSSPARPNRSQRHRTGPESCAGGGVFQRHRHRQRHSAVEHQSRRPRYPLRGELKSAPAPFAAETSGGGRNPVKPGSRHAC